MKRYLAPSLPLAALGAVLLVSMLALGPHFFTRTACAEDEAAQAEAPAEDEVDPNPSTIEKMKEVHWPGLVTIYTGHNWNEDKPYLQAIADCGFGSAGCAEWQIDEVGEVGMKAYVFLWAHEAATIPQKHVDNDTVLCYYYSDRVPPNQWGAWAEYERQSYSGDPHHPAMMTMLARWGAIDQYCNIVKGRALEYYHYHWDGNRSPENYYVYLEAYRQASLANGNVPICRLVETRAEDTRRTRQTIFTSLAYGTRGFKTGGSGLFDYNNRDENGVPARTEHGEEALRFNRALAFYSPIFEKVRSVDVFHTAPLWNGTKEAPADYWVRPTGDEIVLGEFADPEADSDDTHYLVLANRDAGAGHEATLHFASGDVTVELMSKETGEWQTVEVTPDGSGAMCTVPLIEGDGELLKVQGGNWPARTSS